MSHQPSIPVPGQQELLDAVAARPPFQMALTELLHANWYAHSARCDIWDFAVEIHRLREYGLNETDFRWLVCSGFVEHANEVTQNSHDARCFEADGKLTFSRRSCFVLTGEGIMFARGVVDRQARRRERAATDTQPSSQRRPTPVWDDQQHELRVGGELVKRYKWPAVNQERILAVFQEEGWPPRIDDPLPPQPGQDPKRRLHDTIKCLNKHQKHKRVQFRGDGRGQGVMWELVDGPNGVRHGPAH